MVNLGWAVHISGDDATCVGPEDIVASGDSDVHGLQHEPVKVVCGAISLAVAWNSRNALRCLVSTVSFLTGIARSIGIVRLPHDQIGFEPVVSPEVPATTATLVAGRAGAIDKLLRRHNFLFIAGDNPGGLNGLN